MVVPRRHAVARASYIKLVLCGLFHIRVEHRQRADLNLSPQLQVASRCHDCSAQNSWADASPNGWEIGCRPVLRFKNWTRRELRRCDDVCRLVSFLRLEPWQMPWPNHRDFL